jgi:hypothetical protein
MHKIIIEKLILKKSYNTLVSNFCDVSIDFFLLLLIHQENEVTRLAFFEEEATFDNYVINLNTDNTRTLSDKIFEFEPPNNSLEFSLILLENSTRTNLSRAKIKKIIQQNTLLFLKNKRIQFHELIKLKINNNTFINENNISFCNSIFSIHFYLKK